ncbi:uncharacterized protein FYW49_004632 [Xenentodon cancila]
MSSLSSKSPQEISELLDEYGIKHGPVVDSTRGLYERKLKEAMSGGKKARPPSDKTYYREEEEEVTYVYRTPVSMFVLFCPLLSSKYNFQHFPSRPCMYDTPSTYRNSSLKATPMKSGQDAPKTPKSSRLIPLWVQFLFFLAVAVFLYLVFTNMETNEFFKGIE